GSRTVGEQDAQSAHVVARLAVDDGAGAGRVVADHAAQVGPAGGGHVGAELQAVRRQLAVELIEDHTRLHAGRAAGGINGEDLVEVLAAVDDDAGADGLAREAGAAAARGDGHAHLGGDLDGGVKVLRGPRQDDAERLDLVDAGVGAV